MSALFSALSLSPSIIDNLNSLGFSQMTPIQHKSLPVILTGRDVLGQAATGSGKTAAFGLGLLNKLLVDQLYVQAMVVCPTRELCEQVSNALRKFARRLPNIKLVTLVGKNPMHAQETALLHGVHCVVGTPGRILDHVRRGKLDLSRVETLVLDEADRMLHMGFLNEVMAIVKETPSSRQTLLFSATIPDDMHAFLSNVQTNPVFIKDDELLGEPVQERFFEKRGDECTQVRSLLNHFQPESALVFCNTKRQCAELAQKLRANGLFAAALHGDLEQRERDEALMLFSNKSLSILVATDVAARGLDIHDLSMVINVDLARNADVHLHRVGRTGRAGKTGLAVTLFAPTERERIDMLLKARADVAVIGAWEELNQKEAPKPAMATMRISCGRKNKLRAGDILGALTASGEFTRDDVGLISIGETHSFVAVAFTKAERALHTLTHRPIKGKFLKTQHLSIPTTNNRANDRLD